MCGGRDRVDGPDTPCPLGKYVEVMLVAEHAERLKEVERQREELRSLAITNGGESARHAERADKAKAALADRDNRIAEALYWLDGGDSEAAEAALKDLERVPPPAFTQPSSNPPQQDREDENSSGVEAGAPKEVGFNWRPLRVNLPGGGTASVLGYVVSDDDDGSLQVMVRDEGAGFDRDDLLIALTQPEADPEVPRCGGSGKISILESALAEETPRTFDQMQAERSGALAEVLDGIEAVANEHYHGGEDELRQQIADEIARARSAEDALDSAPERDCQPTPELLGEEAKQSEEVAAAFARCLSLAQNLEQEHAALNLYDATKKWVEATTQQPVSESPGNSGERLTGKQATVRLPECASEQGEPKTEIPFIWGFRAEYGPTLDELREKALGELRKAGIEYHGRDLLPDADSPSPEHWRLEARPDSEVENDFDLRFVGAPGREQLLALRDRLLGAEAVDAAVEAALEHPDTDVPPGSERTYRDNWRPIIRAELAAAWNRATGHDHSLLLTQPVPGNSGGVEEAAKKLATIRSWCDDTPGPVDTGGWLLASMLADFIDSPAASTQPPSPQAAKNSSKEGDDA